MRETVCVDRSACACVVLRGADRVDFLNRMATNELSTLPAGRAAPTFFLERTGRVVDRSIVVPSSDRTLLLGSAGRGPALAEWLTKHVIADDVTVEDETQSTAQLLVLGEAPAMIGAAFGIASETWSPWEHRAGTAAGVDVVRTEDVAGPSFRIVGPAGESSQWLTDLPRLTDEEWRARRVEAGIPEFGAEFTERTIPLELRQADHFSFTKGCYVGQEVVARLYNYKRVKRALVRLRVAGREPVGPGAALFDGEREVGTTTSVARTGDSLVALGFVEAGLEDPGRRLFLRQGEDVRDTEVLMLSLRGDTP